MAITTLLDAGKENKKDKEADLKIFIKNVQSVASDLESYAIATFMYQYSNNSIDFFIYRFNELNVIGFDISTDALLLNPSANMHDKITHFVKTYYVQSRMSHEYISNVYHTLQTLTSKDNTSLHKSYQGILKKYVHKHSDDFEPAQNVCLFIIGIDVHIICTPNYGPSCNTDTIKNAMQLLTKQTK
jgi:hypothetical protein